MEPESLERELLCFYVILLAIGVGSASEITLRPILSSGFKWIIFVASLTGVVLLRKVPFFSPLVLMRDASLMPFSPLSR